MGSTSKAEKQEKKRKQREDAIGDALVTEDEQPKTRKRKRDAKPALDGRNAEGTDDAKQKKKMDKKREDDSPALLAAPADEVEQPVDKPKRKSKKRDSAAATTPEPLASEDADNAASPPSKKEKKKRKDKEDKDASGTKGNKSKYPDPAGDETLSDQAQKGLAYAHSYAIQSDWKFNKARQNWLMKHIYDPAMVPDAYVRMVVHYLKSIKGQALEHMRKTCQTMIEQPPADGKPPDEAVTDGATTADCATEIQVARAVALLKKLPKSTTVPTAEND